MYMSNDKIEKQMGSRSNKALYIGPGYNNSS